MIVKADGIERRFFRRNGESNFFYAVGLTDFVLREGCFAVISGRSGSGKSTFLNMLAGLLEPSSGRVLYGDKDIYAIADEERSVFRNRHIGVVPQGQTGLSVLTVLENVMLPCAMYGNEKGKEKSARELLERVGIANLADVYPNELSGGELRRMAIARALITDPSVVFADEPTGDLDDANTEAVLKLFREISDGGASVLMVTHERDADVYADEVFRMNNGILSSV